MNFEGLDFKSSWWSKLLSWVFVVPFILSSIITLLLIVAMTGTGFSTRLFEGAIVELKSILEDVKSIKQKQKEEEADGTY